MNHTPVKNCTYERSLVGHGGQDVVQDEQQYRDGQQHGDFEAQLLSSMVWDEEGGEVQTQEEQDGQQKVDDMEEGPPPHGELGKQVQGSDQIDQMTTGRLFLCDVFFYRCKHKKSKSTNIRFC